MTSDPISDMLARIRNAALARHEQMHMPASKLKRNIAEILKAEGYVADVREDEVGELKHQTLTIVLKYGNDKRAAFHGLKRVSRPGRRVYVGAGEIPRVLGGYGINIVSTSQGLMSGKKARKENVGGEILAEVY